MNSSQIAKLPEWLEKFRPVSLIVCVGVNNIWNRSETDDAYENSSPKSWLEDLRVVRLARLIILAFNSRTLKRGLAPRPDLQRVVLGEGRLGVEHRDAINGKVLIYHTGSFYETVPLEKAQAILMVDLASMLESTRKWNTQLVVLTYLEYPVSGPMNLSQENHILTNKHLRSFAAANHLMLVDPAVRINVLLAEGSKPSTYFHADKFHPSSRGYKEIASLLADVLEPRPHP